MKIVVLDGKSMNPGDLSWKDLEKLGIVDIYPNTNPDQLKDRIKGAHVIITNKVIIDANAIYDNPDLKLILLSATGYNNVDIETASANGILVCNASGYGTPSVAQHCFALILELTNRCGEYSEDIKNNGWFEANEWTYQINPSIELAGKTLGIVGFGNIGKYVAKIGQAFGMKIIVFHNHEIEPSITNIKQVSFDDLLKLSDIVTLHCPLTQQNKGMMNKQSFELMKPSSLLINTSRGGLVNEVDLAYALKNQLIQGAGLDVINKEPPAANHSLSLLTNCIITPHRAWATRQARQRLLNIVVDNLKSYMEGSPKNVIT